MSNVIEQPKSPEMYGKWVYDNNGNMTCSYCNSSIKESSVYYKYCPNCGAEMYNDVSVLCNIAIHYTITGDDMYLSSLVIDTLMNSSCILESMTNTQLLNNLSKIGSCSESKNFNDNWSQVYNKIKAIYESRLNNRQSEVLEDETSR